MQAFFVKSAPRLGENRYRNGCHEHNREFCVKSEGDLSVPAGKMQYRKKKSAE